jgi:exonuclease 1
MLIHFGVKPYMVFDGDYLPSKAATEASREKSRDEKKKLAFELLKAGKPAQAAQEFQKCIDITPEMASAVIQKLKEMNIDYVVAPYEADAQLVYLERKGLIDGIISDDSDLLVFGAKRLLTKLDRYGSCIEINRRDFCACREVSLTGWSDAEFRRMAIMSGCDYLEGLPTVGLKTAYRMLRKSKTPERVVQMLQFQGKRVSENYLADFYKAELTFLHQWVFCPIKKELVHLTELPADRTAEEMPYIGAHVEPTLARAIADGDVNPITKRTIPHALTPTKRRHSQTSTMATASPSPAKPINSYFKGHSRIPMGAMDPNCFTVDPQRLAQLTDGGMAPRVFPLPRPYLDEAQRPGPPRMSSQADTRKSRTSPRLQRRRTEPISNMLSQMTSSPASRTASSQHKSSPSLQSSASEQPSRPSKKARLCDETVDLVESPKKSKFFTPAKTAKSPRRAKSEAYLLSDDSIEEALASLPDFDGWKTTNKSRKSISIFEESALTDIGENKQTSSQMTTTTEATARSASTQEQLREKQPQFSSRTSMPPPTTTKRTSVQPGTPSESRLHRFSYTSNSSSATPLSSATSRRSSIFSAVSTPDTAPSTAAASSSRPTALQRIAARAFHAPASPKPRERIDKGRSGPLSGLPVNPSFVPLPKVDLDEVAALSQPCGSEDQIIPDSDGEDEEDLHTSRPTKLNLSQFAFSRS